MARALPERSLELALIAAAFAPLLLGVANEIQQVDPAQYAEVARRVFESGQPAGMHDAFGPYRDKPPITFWLIALAFRLFGETSFAVRLPVLLLGIALLFATARIGALLWDGRTGRLAAALLGSSLAFQLMVADPKIDMGVTTFMAWAVCCLLEGRRRPGRMYLAWFFAGLGILTKGPIGLSAPAVAVLPEALRRRWGRPEEDRGLWSRLAPFKPLAGPLLLAAMVVPWLVESQREFGAQEGPLFLLWHQSFGRLFERDYRNDTSPFFFLHTALWAFLPFTPVLLFELGRRFVAWCRAGLKLPPDEARVVLWWLLLPFVAISASSYKLPQYLYWLSPPAALLAARALTRLGEAGAPRPLRVLAGIQVGLTAVGLALVGAVLQLCFPPPLPVKLLWLLGVVAVTLAGYALGRRLRPDARLAALCVFTLAGFNAFFEGYLHPALLNYQPDREFGERVRQVDPTGQVLPFVPEGATNASAFYARRDVAEMTPADLASFVRAGRTKVAITTPQLIPALEASGLTVERLLELPTYHTSQPTGRFLRARTRPEVVSQLVLVRLTPRGN